MDKICDEKKCFGCAACIDKCPVSCIHFEQNTVGHFVPKIDTTKCIDCKSCVKICPANNLPEQKYPVEVLAAWRKSEPIRIKSSSGGLATVLSEYVINNGGIVYGASFVSGFRFNHIRCTAHEELDALRGSKYVQSNMRGIYKNISNDLKNGLKVLFIGTPCQVAGIKNAFANHDENLMTIDLVCHGVPSNAMLQASLPKRILNSDADRIDFRESTRYLFSVKKGDLTIFERPLNRDYYSKGFFVGLFYRDSCYICPFAQSRRIGDITLGDFWGIDRSVVPIDPKTGISLFLVNTTKGQKLYKEILPEIGTIVRPYDEAIQNNKQLKSPKPASFRSRLFRILFPVLGFKWSIRLSIPEIIVKGLFVKSQRGGVEMID